MREERRLNEADSDRLLLKKVRAGDKRAFDLLVLKYQQRIFSLIARYVADTHEVEDIAQETFIRAYRALPKFRGDSAFYTWLYRIAVNTAKNHLAARARRPAGGDIDLDAALHHEAGGALRDEATPERDLLGRELERAVYEALGNLPEDLRGALTLREFDGLSYEAIAEVMECPIGTVRSRIFRAREAIDRRVQTLLAGEPARDRDAV